MGTKGKVEMVKKEDDENNNRSKEMKREEMESLGWGMKEKGKKEMTKGKEGKKNA